MEFAYCGNTGTSGSPRFITHGSGGAVATAKNTMKKDSRQNSKTYKGHTIPYGTLADASQELIKVYYYHGYKEDSMLPEFPCLPYEEEPYIDPDEELRKKELAEHVQEMLDGLTPREAKVLQMRFGIGLDSDYTLEEVGVAFRVTRERIRQIEARAMRKMKHPFRSEILRQFYADEYYKTTEEKKREAEARQRQWREEVESRQRMHYREKTMPPEQKELWQELKPALQDATWVINLKVHKPEMYQELKELVGDLWGMSAKDIWKKYTKGLDDI
jgi:RNA polymerase sigma factor (sigma-70 family)